MWQMSRILVIDDDPMVRFTVSLMLKKGGYEVHLAEDGLEGLKSFRSFRPDLVVTDMVMPTKGGLDTINLLREWSPDLKIIAISGGARLGNKDLLAEAIRLGATRIISKPFESEDLLTAVRECLVPVDHTEA
jgi:CheY-like chemotaxis protein